MNKKSRHRPDYINIKFSRLTENCNGTTVDIVKVKTKAKAETILYYDDDENVWVVEGGLCEPQLENMPLWILQK